MSSTVQPMGTGEQDRTLSDLLESYRHLQADPGIDSDRKRRATERMKPVWANLAKLQDPDGFVNHLSEFVQRAYVRRHHAADDPDLTRRSTPLCRCDRSRHVCEAKQGEIPSKIRTQDLKFIHKPDSRTLAHEYVQEHSGDVVIREAMESYRDLRASIYSELSDILAMLMGKDPQPTEDGERGADVEPSEEHDPSPSEEPEAVQAATAAADGGGESDPTDDADPNPTGDEPAMADLPPAGMEIEPADGGGGDE